MEGEEMKRLLLEGMMAAAIALTEISGPALRLWRAQQIGRGGRL
jgi:hypothetical protein